MSTRKFRHSIMSPPFLVRRKLPSWGVRDDPSTKDQQTHPAALLSMQSTIGATNSLGNGDRPATSYVAVESSAISEQEAEAATLHVTDAAADCSAICHHHAQDQQHEQQQQSTRQQPLSSCRALLQALPPSQDEAQILEKLRGAVGVLRKHREESAATGQQCQEIEFIPVLVNRIILESRNQDTECKRTVEITDALVTLVLDFAEPYVMEISRHCTNKNNARAAKSNGYSSGQIQSIGGGMNGSIDYASKYRDRAIQWAVECIRDLLRPPDAGTAIPELDALLSASGPHNGLAHERNVQDRLVESLEGLQSKLASVTDTDTTSAVDGADLRDILALLEKRRSGSKDVKVSSQSITWTTSPEEWLKEVESIGHGEINKDTEEDFGLFPYLGQMRDFMRKHEGKSSDEQTGAK